MQRSAREHLQHILDEAAYLIDQVFILRAKGSA